MNYTLIDSINALFDTIKPGFTIRMSAGFRYTNRNVYLGKDHVVVQACPSHIVVQKGNGSRAKWLRSDFVRMMYQGNTIERITPVA